MIHELQGPSLSCAQTSNGTTLGDKQSGGYSTEQTCRALRVHLRQNLICIPACNHSTVFRTAGHHPVNSIQACELQLPLISLRTILLPPLSYQRASYLTPIGGLTC